MKLIAPFPSYSSLIQKLQFAKQKLQTKDVPHLLAVISYLRISCSIMQKVNYQPFSEQQTEDLKITYSNLITTLANYDAAWWQKCQVSATGGLESNDPVINHLLQPIEQFHLDLEQAQIPQMQPQFTPKSVQQPKVRIKTT